MDLGLIISYVSIVTAEYGAQGDFRFTIEATCYRFVFVDEDARDHVAVTLLRAGAAVEREDETILLVAR